MPPSSRRNLALQARDEPTKRYDRKAMLGPRPGLAPAGMPSGFPRFAAPLFRPELESVDDFAPTLSGGRCYERLIGREKVASIISSREDVLATRELPRIDAKLLRASLPSSPDLDDAATNEVRPFAKTEEAPVVSMRELAPLLDDPREAETAERVAADSPADSSAVAEPVTERALADDTSFPIVVEIEEPVAEAAPKPAPLSGPRKNKLRRALSRTATVVGLSAIVVFAVLFVRSPEAKVRFPASVSVASRAVVRFASRAMDVAVRGARRIHSNVEASS